MHPMNHVLLHIASEAPKFSQSTQLLQMMQSTRTGLSRCIFQFGTCSHGLKQNFQSVEEYGPSPQDLIDFVSEGLSRYRSRIDRAADTLTSLREIHDLVNIAKTSPNAMSHQLILISRCDNIPAFESTISDDVLVDFKTDHIARHVLTYRRESIELSSAEETFCLCGRYPVGSTLCGWLFEFLAIRYISEQNKYSSYISTFSKMSLRSGRTFVSRHLRGKENALVVCDHSSVVQARERLINGLNPVHPETTVTSLPTKGRMIVHYYDSLERVLSGSIRQGLWRSYVYVPSIPNTPLFDAILFDWANDAATCVNMFVLQVATRKSHRESEDGYVTLRQARQAFEKIGKKVEIQYVLIAPRGRHDVVQWEMPPGFEDDEVRGNITCN
ncbi:hypothetical protein C8Q75DRAFT_286370 [Abortiporus biennis]|nr:hypothetical protein C8Q75DRAFT_286370 [Abortiporus biennis]